MSVKASELPDLITALVRKAVADKVITDETLQSLVHKPFRVGILPFPPLADLEVGRSAPEVSLAEPQPSPWKTIGYVIDNLDELRTPDKLKATAD